MFGPDSSSWFFYGSPAAVSQPKFTQSALYSPVLDRFIVVFDDQDILRKISLCWSNRCQLVLCELAEASNFATNLIDNSVCLDWTMADTNQLKWTRFPDFNKPAYRVQELLPTTDPVPQNELIIQNIEYIWASITWLWIEKNQLRSKLHVIPPNLMCWLGMPYALPDNFDIAQQIGHTIYTELNFAKAQEKIQKIFNQYEHSDFSKINLRINGAQQQF